MKDRRFGPTVLAGLGASALTAVAAAQPWAEADGDNAGVAVSAVADGNDVAPLALALALVALASWGVLLVLRGSARRLVAVVGTLAAGGVLAAVVSAFGSAQDAAVDAAQAAGATGDTFTSSLTAWYWTTGVAAAFSLAALGVAVARAPRWPSMGSRYDAPSARETSPATTEDLWKALDEGHDPTA
ncbi:MAG TPA: Trp biosynthesis-associated membrane protein [Nocardioides sp.]|uniref:Trp biosynthesis-associated membrane protein n=1 Tax=Nocardioides sp. TaxID=35761 RepID=UPI002D7EA260|nr:Trp biosynthesis-associated membrane protein [Nocardioides sp.]HET6651533.1 Trp biosynthesis-associated membrane protein [Nocardioides sp.]